MRNQIVRSRREQLRRYIAVPAALALSALMVSRSMEIREQLDQPPTTKAQPMLPTSSLPSSITTVALPETTSSSTTTTILAQTVGERSLLASGILFDGRGMRFERERAIGVDCQSTNPVARTNTLRLPADLGSSALSINPLVSFERVVFLGQETRPSDGQRVYLSDGIAIGRDNGQFKVLDFRVEQLPGGALANAEGAVVAQPSTATLQAGVSYSNNNVSFKAQLNPTAPPNEQLSLTVQCR